MLSLLGAIASAPTDCVLASGVRDVHTFVVASYVQMPPCAAPRMIVPSLRPASAPTRPDTASSVLDVRAGCTTGSGPTFVHVPPRADPRRVSAAIPLAWVEACERSVAARSMLMPPSSPASKRLQ